MHSRRTRNYPDMGSFTRIPRRCSGMVMEMAADEISLRMGFHSCIAAPRTYRCQDSLLKREHFLRDWQWIFKAWRVYLSDVHAEGKRGVPACPLGSSSR